MVLHRAVAGLDWLSASWSISITFSSSDFISSASEWVDTSASATVLSGENKSWFSSYRGKGKYMYVSVYLITPPDQLV